MFRQPENNFIGVPTSKTEPILPDPWDAPEPEPHFPSPLELDRLLREPHPLIRAASDLRRINPAGIPGADLLPTHTDFEVNPAQMLLTNELKLHDHVVEKCKGQIQQALALLYWLDSKPKQFFA
jgi:hypothetical protein